MKEFVTLGILIFMFFYTFQNVKSANPSIIFSQIMIGQDGASNNEFIELFNLSDRDIDLTGYSLKKKTQSGTVSSLISPTKFIGTIKAHGYFLIAHPGYNIDADLSYSSASYYLSDNNSALLYDANNNLLDKVGWGSAGDFETIATPSIEAGKSIVRKKSNNLPVDTDNNSSDFETKTFPVANNSKSIIEQSASENESGATKEENQTTLPSVGSINENNELEEADIDKKPISEFEKIKITEIFPNPKSRQVEFIELYNSSYDKVDLRGWEISNGDKKVVISKIASSTFLAGEKYLVIWRQQSKFPLYNKGSIQLFAPLKSKAAQIVKYSDAPAGQSYDYICETVDSGKKCSWAWSETITPGENNILKIANRKPRIVMNLPDEINVGEAVYFDASDSDDEDGDELTYEWDFGDGIKNNMVSPEHTYLKSGNYKVSLTIKDKYSFSKSTKNIKVFGDDIKIVLNDNNKNDYKIIINEIIPNPTGSDDAEWIELYNNEAKEVDLTGWTLFVNSKSYTFPTNTKIRGRGYLVIKREQSHLALGNQNGKIQLENLNKEIIDELEYDMAVEGESFARGKNDNFFWTTKPTLGKENIIIVSDSEENKNTIIKTLTKNAKTKKETNPTAITLEQVQDIGENEQVILKGIVAVEPGVFGSQYFYITGSPGLKIYNYKKEFPKLAIGDKIEVSGELSTIDGEKRLKTLALGDIKILKRGESIKPRQVNIEDLGIELAGSLVAIAGQLTKKTSTNFYLDDNSHEAVVLIKKNTQIKSADYNEGDQLLITGIVGLSKNEPVIMPRSKNDIKLISTIKQTEFLREPKVLGEITENDSWTIPTKKSSSGWIPYVVIIFVASIIISGIIFYRTKKEKGSFFDPL